jgi:hypothetical protein
VSQCLEFRLPGHDIVLRRASGSDDAEDVTLSNLDEYIDAVVRSTLVDTIETQVCAFRSGFADLGSLATLAMFTGKELAALLSSSDELSEHLWNPRVVAKHVVCQHGYTVQSTQASCGRALASCVVVSCASWWRVAHRCSCDCLSVCRCSSCSRS